MFYNLVDKFKKKTNLMAALIVKVTDSELGNLDLKLDVNLDTICPFDLIQVLYQKGCKPKPSGGGTTIWKMGKSAGAGDLNSDSTFANQHIVANTPVFLDHFDV